MRFSLEFGAPREARSSSNLENPSVSLVDPKAWAQIFGDWRSSAGVSVDANVAMTVPAVWCAVNFLCNCMASLPIKLHRKSVNGTETIERGPMVAMLTGKVNDEFLTSFNWRRDMMASTLLRGRGLSFVEKMGAGTGDAMALWPIQRDKTTIARKAGKLTYTYRDTASSTKQVYTPGEMIDIKFLGQLDGVSEFDPVMSMKDTIGLGVALRNYASRYFEMGGVPPLAMSGPAASPAAVDRAKTDVNEAVKESTRSDSNVLYLPTGHTLTPIGFNPEKSQLLEAQQFIIQEVSRLYNIPPAFLHYLMNSTYANVEQQDINFVKHCLVHWVEQWEAELNLKLFGTAKGRYVQFDLSELLRGDFLSRMQGYASAIQNAVLMPNEARRRENLPDAPGGDVLMVNTAIQPIGTKPASAANVADPNVDPNADPNAKPAKPGAVDGEEDPIGDPQVKED